MTVDWARWTAEIAAGVLEVGGEVYGVALYDKRKAAPYCVLTSILYEDEQLPFPTDPRRIYNLLICLGAPVELSLIPTTIPRDAIQPIGMQEKLATTIYAGVRLAALEQVSRATELVRRSVHSEAHDQFAVHVAWCEL